MQVDLRELRKVLDYLRSINKEDINNIEWTLDGQIVHIDQRDINQWRFVGLNNVDFPRYAFDKDSKEGKLFNIHQYERDEDESV